MKARWKPLQRADWLRPITDADIRIVMDSTGLDYQTARAQMEHECRYVEYWINDVYQVALRRFDHNQYIHLNIRRRDGKVIFRDWRHFQWIKNQLVGEECEGFEIYPAESRLNDTSNKYHIWVYTDPRYRIPVGMDQRDVTDDTGTRKPGYRQRRL